MTGLMFAVVRCPTDTARPEAGDLYLTEWPCTGPHRLVYGPTDRQAAERYLLTALGEPTCPTIFASTHQRRAS